MDTPLVIGTAIIALVLTIVVAVFFFKSNRAGARKAAGLLRKSRNMVLMCGLAGSGKTAMFLRLTTGEVYDTLSSMVPNTGTACGTKIVDFPGARRMRKELLEALAEAKKVIVVVDSVRAQDDIDGASSVAELMCDMAESRNFSGVSEILVACTKRDELTSYTSKSVRRLLETEITKVLVSRESALGSLRTARNVAGGGSGAADTAAESSAGFMLNELQKFSFQDGGSPVPVTFVDVSAKPNADAPQFTLAPVEEFLGS